jgi:hypothetical protein
LATGQRCGYAGAVPTRHDGCFQAWGMHQAHCHGMGQACWPHQNGECQIKVALF